MFIFPYIHICVWNCFGIFFRLGIFFLIYGSVHFPCYLHHFEPGSCYFHSICRQHFGFRTIVFASFSWNLYHFGAGSCHFSGLDFYMVVPQFSLIFPKKNDSYMVFIDFFEILIDFWKYTMCKL